MKTWKLLGLAIIGLALVLLIGCGKAEEEPAAEPEPEAAEVVAAVDYTPTVEEIGTEFTCVMCGMTKTVAEETPSVTYEGNTNYLCSDYEKVSFVADPAKALTAPDSTEPAVEEGDTQ